MKFRKAQVMELGKNTGHRFRKNKDYEVKKVKAQSLEIENTCR